MIVDAGPLIALLDRTDPRHRHVRDLLASTKEPLHLSPFVLAEVDHYTLARMNGRAELALLADLVSGAFLLEPFTGRDVALCANVIARFPNLGLGIADASIVVLAERHRTLRVLTFDRRDFAVLRTSRNQALELLP